MITYYFHVTKESRIKYKFEENLFSLKGNLIISDFPTARLLSEKINTVRRSEGKFDQQVTAGQINALGLLHEIFHLLIRVYEGDTKKGIFNNSLEFLKKNLSEDDLDKTLLKFVQEFPPLSVYQDKIKAEDFLNGKTDDKSNREIILEELIILNLENINPATYQLKELYTDENLVKETKYKEIIEQTELFFENEPKIGGFNLVSFLRKPIIQSPYNIEEQLEIIRTIWKDFIDENTLNKILLGKDLIHEDYKLFVQHGAGEKGTPPVPSYEFDYKYFDALKAKLAEGKKLSPEEYEYYQLEVKRFTQDLEWMPRVVMIAKNAFVWLHQLSKKYGKEIKRLDEIPDEELDNLAKWNFTALWLIGIWERSSASRKIKQMMGNPEAASSAYSLYDYVIANELGGESAFQNLKDRAWQRGIRLSSDMVPNHTGIYSKWVVEKPDYFIQRKNPPYPNYKFTGPNLSDDGRVEVRIEDQYYSKTDAAVIFERLDSYTGDRTYIYHGNDGTNMPWNDTAQLDLMKPEVRESLIQTIMHVARKTPIIRFDAAMTLAKKHYQRLWFPIPGSGGAIPSRAEYAMTRSQFDAQMPQEFWREVVDRINSEMPDTLLLAEAFWLMEGYFVRTLGMHRVYNSAFMHMFMKEENEKYRLLIKNTLAFNPEILKRYVNFMSNPDEETAINQFGKGDKYFGVATLLVTLPGLPMFAHGQLEGFSEKYGMEYKRSYYEEFVDNNLIWEHEQKIFPLTKKRYLFSQVDNFEFYDFLDPKGNVNENVFAYTNRAGNEVVLIIYNNSYSEAFGTINYSCEKAYGEEGRTSNLSIEKALRVNPAPNHFYIYRDRVDQLEYLISGQQVSSSGIYFHLMGYQRKVMLDFREVYDSDGSYKAIYDQLQGRGVDSIDRLLNELNLAPFHNSLINFYTSIKFSKILLSLDVKTEDDIEIPEIDEELIRIYKELSKFSHISIPNDELIERIKNQIENLKSFNSILYKSSSDNRSTEWLKDIYPLFFQEDDQKRKEELSLLLFHLITSQYLFSLNNFNPNENIYDKLFLWKPFFEISGFMKFNDVGKNYELSKALFQSVFLTTNEKEKLTKKNKNEDLIFNHLSNLFNITEFNNFVQLHDYLGNKYFNKERIGEFLRWNLILSALNTFEKNNKNKKISLVKFKSLLKQYLDIYKESNDRILKSDYKLNNLLKEEKQQHTKAVVKRKTKKAVKEKRVAKKPRKS